MKAVRLIGIVVASCGLVIAPAGRADSATNLSVEGVIQQAGNSATGASAVAIGTNTVADAENSLAGGFNAWVQPGHSNALIFATGQPSPGAMRQTQYPDTAHFEHLYLFSPSYDDGNSVLPRWENDARYATAGGVSDLWNIMNDPWDYGSALTYWLASVATIATEARTDATNAMSFWTSGGFILTNTADFGGQSASNIVQIYIGYPTQTLVEVRGNGAVEFDGNGYAATPSGNWFPAAGNKSVFVWVNPSSDGVIFQAGIGDAGAAFRLMRNSGRFWFWGGYSADVWMTNEIPADAWTLLTASYDGASHTASFYVNDVLAAEHVYPLLTAQWPQVALGAYAYTGGGNIAAKFGPSGVYSNALSYSDVTNLYNGGIGNLMPPTDNLIAFWPMQDGSGTTLTDVSGKGNSLTISGGAAWVPAPFATNFTYVSATLTNSFAFVPADAPHRPGDYLAFDGAFGTYWASLPPDLVHFNVATNLNLSGNSITNVQSLKVNGPVEFLGPISIGPQGDLDMGSFTNKP